jgi:putative FmdB family regulatory protein
MPTYDFRCLNCRRRFDVFMTYQDYGKDPVVCPACGSDNVLRRVNRIRIAKSDESRLAEMGDPSSLEHLDEDPRALGQMMRKAGDQLGEDMGPEFNEVVGRLESGQSPDEIEKNLPDLGAGGGDDFGGGDLDGF